MNYNLVKVGNREAREYWGKNKSPLFKGIPDENSSIIDFQKRSYEDFINHRLPNLFKLNFPFDIKDYNNTVRLDVKELKVDEPLIEEEEARRNSQTWSHSVNICWSVEWKCKGIQIRFIKDEGEEEVSEKDNDELSNYSLYIKSLNFWLKNTFDSLKLGNFLISEISEDLLEIKETKTDGTIETDGVFIELKIDKEKTKESTEGFFFVSFVCKQQKMIFLCSIPKLTKRGCLLINGHNKAIVFQSVRSPGVYNFLDEESKDILTEVIPQKGPWIAIENKGRNVKMKFLNSGLIVDLFNIFATYFLPKDKLITLFNVEDLDFDDYHNHKKMDVGINLPKFIFSGENSYFKMGRIGRRKCDNKIGIYSFFDKIKGKKIAEELFDFEGNKIFDRHRILDDESISIILSLLKNNKLPLIDMPDNNFSKIFSLKILIDIIDEKGNVEEKIFPVLTNDLYFPNDNDDEKDNLGYQWKGYYRRNKNFFDLSDLICIISNRFGLRYGLGHLDSIKEKDSLHNQVIRRIGDLFYNIVDNELGAILKHLENTYLAYLSSLNLIDFERTPALMKINRAIKVFSNLSVLIQLSNENNPWSEDSHMRKVSVLGYGGFSDRRNSGATLDARNANITYSGKYDPIETPEGQKVGLIHYLANNPEIDEDGQLKARYFAVKNGKICPGFVYLDSEEEYDKYIVHQNIDIDSENRILESELPVFYKGKVITAKREQIDYIYSSFYQLNSNSTSAIPFFEKNDPTRILMAANLMKQAIPSFSNQEPLILSGSEASLFSNSSFIVKSNIEGVIDYADSSKVVIKGKGDKKEIYKVPQSVFNNKNILINSRLLVKKGDAVKKDQAVSCASYFSDNKILSLGYNLRVAFMCWHGFNYEDALILSSRLVKEGIFESSFAKRYTLIRSHTKNGEEVLTKAISNVDKDKLSKLDDNGIIKIGSEVKGGDILVGKLTPQPAQHKESEEELLLLNILGVKSQRFIDSSLYLPKWEVGVVYAIERKELKKRGNSKRSTGDLELIEVFVAQRRSIEVGDKLTTRFGNKGVVSKIVEESNMPFDKDGRPMDILINPLGISSRMSFGLLAETILSRASEKIGTPFLFKPFNSPNSKFMENIAKEAGVENFGNDTLFDGNTGLPYENKIYTGFVYIFALIHKSWDKRCDRNIGPRSMITQQPLKGRANNGGLRLGEMEISALIAHRASKIIFSSLSYKSDSMSGRRDYREAITIPFGGGEKNIIYNNARTESFNRILQVLRSIGFDLEAFDEKGKKIDFYTYFSGIKRKELPLKKKEKKNKK